MSHPQPRKALGFSSPSTGSFPAALAPEGMSESASGRPSDGHLNPGPRHSTSLVRIPSRASQPLPWRGALRK